MPPVNDNFADRIALSGNSISITGTNVGATGETGEPDHVEGAALPLSSVWWTWTAPSSGTVAIHTYGSNFDTTLAIYTGSALNSLTEVASNDNYFGDGRLDPESVVVFTTTAGTTYQIAVDGSYDSTGLIQLNLNFKPTPFATRAADFGFESGNFTNWTTIGNASIKTATWGTFPTEGSYQALITTGAASDTVIENAFGLSVGTLDAFINDPDRDVTNGSALRLQPITVKAGDVLSFDWNFLSNVDTGTGDNDVAFVSIAPDLVFKLSDLNDTYGSSSILSATPYYTETGYRTFEYKFTTAGTYTVGIGIVDVDYSFSSSMFTSGLLVDNLNIFSEILGTSGRDCLNGTSANERINGLDGNDRINGNGGYDTLLGGAGNDTITGGSGDDYIDGGDGNDIIYGNGGADTLMGGSGHDRIFGSSEADEIYGGDGNDTIYGNGGNDFINSGSGWDTIFLGAGRATVVLETGLGFDTIKNFQIGQTSLKLGSGLTFADLTFTNSENGTKISYGSDLLAVISSMAASIINNPDIFV